MSLWSHQELSRVKTMVRRDQSVDMIARATGHTKRQVDLALWHLLGRTVEEACDALNLAQIEHHKVFSQGADGVRSAVRLAQ